MKIPNLCTKSYGREKQRLTLCRRLLPIHEPKCDICDTAKSPDFHVLIWEVRDMQDTPIVMCRKCAIEFLDSEPKLEVGYIAHADLVATGLKEFVVFSESDNASRIEAEAKEREEKERERERKRVEYNESRSAMRRAINGGKKRPGRKPGTIMPKKQKGEKCSKLTASTPV